MLQLIARVLHQHLALRIAVRRKPDQVIGEAENPYLFRWYLTPWREAYADIPPAERSWWQGLVSRLPNVYLHCFLRSDDDRALHDHPWNWGSFLLDGRYVEVTHEPSGLGVPLRGADYATVDVLADYLFVTRTYSPGTFRWHRAEFAHRLVIPKGQKTWTLFFCGWRRREWGFHCPQGWVHWRVFTDPSTGGATVGKGCLP
jgi:hypothetical protein